MKIIKHGFLFITGACVAMLVNACDFNCPEAPFVPLESGTYESTAREDAYTTNEWTGAPELENENLAMELDREAGTVVITSTESEFRLELKQ